MNNNAGRAPHDAGLYLANGLELVQFWQDNAAYDCLDDGLAHNRIVFFRNRRIDRVFYMSIATAIGPKPFTHTAYLFIRTGSRKGKVFGYWKNCGDFRQDDDEPFAFIDMVPRGGWDGRIRFVKYGAAPPEAPPAPQRPGSGEDEAEDSED